MEKFDDMYDSLNEIYIDLEKVMGTVYEELQSEPENMDKANLLNGLGSVALKVISLQLQLVESYGSNESKGVLLSNLDDKASKLSEALIQETHKTR